MALTKRLAKPRDFSVRELKRDELTRMYEPRAKGIVAKLRDSHHRVARLFAMGLRIHEVVGRSGYSYQRVYTLTVDPSFEELVSHYRNLVNESFVASADEYHDLVTRNMIAAERHIADAIDEADEEGKLLPIKTALAISRDAADRMGYGKKQTNLNVNVDFAKNLEGMLKRSGKTIEHSSNRPSPPRPMVPVPTLAPAPAAPEPTLRRRLG